MDTCTDRKEEKRQTYLNGETTLSSGVYCTYCILGRSVKITYVPTLQIAYRVGWVHTMLSGSILYDLYRLCTQYTALYMRFEGA